MLERIRKARAVLIQRLARATGLSARHIDESLTILEHFGSTHPPTLEGGDETRYEETEEQIVVRHSGKADIVCRLRVPREFYAAAIKLASTDEDGRVNTQRHYIAIDTAMRRLAAGDPYTPTQMLRDASIGRKNDPDYRRAGTPGHFEITDHPDQRSITLSASFDEAAREPLERLYRLARRTNAEPAQLLLAAVYAATHTQTAYDLELREQRLQERERAAARRPDAYTPATALGDWFLQQGERDERMRRVRAAKKR